MIKLAWYYLLRTYIKLGLWFFCDELKCTGRDNIPADGAVIFTSNHNNAFLDAILIISKTKRVTYSLTRSDVFAKKFYRIFLRSLHLLPIFRVRDGLRSVTQNHETFNRTSEILKLNNAVIIFPEAQHHHDRQLKKISKGFTRVAFESAKKNPSSPLHIIPVGINYHHFYKFPIRVQINFGEAINVHEYLRLEDGNSAIELRNDVEREMQRLVTHIPDALDYDEVLKDLQLQQVDFTSAQSTNERIRNWQKDEETISLNVLQKIPVHLKLLRLPLYLNNVLPLSIWSHIQSKIKDPVFIGSIKFGVGVFLFPLCYLLQSVGIFFLFGLPIATWYFLFSLFSMNALKAFST